MSVTHRQPESQHRISHYGWSQTDPLSSGIISRSRGWRTLGRPRLERRWKRCIVALLRALRGDGQAAGSSGPEAARQRRRTTAGPQPASACSQRHKREVGLVLQMTTIQRDTPEARPVEDFRHGHGCDGCGQEACRTDVGDCRPRLTGKRKEADGEEGRRGSHDYAVVVELPQERRDLFADDAVQMGRGRHYCAYIKGDEEHTGSANGIEENKIFNSARLRWCPPYNAVRFCITASSPYT